MLSSDSPTIPTTTTSSQSLSNDDNVASSAVGGSRIAEDGGNRGENEGGSGGVGDRSPQSHQDRQRSSRSRRDRRTADISSNTRCSSSSSGSSSRRNYGSGNDSEGGNKKSPILVTRQHKASSSSQDSEDEARVTFKVDENEHQRRETKELIQQRRLAKLIERGASSSSQQGGGGGAFTVDLWTVTGVIFCLLTLVIVVGVVSHLTTRDVAPIQRPPTPRPENEVFCYRPTVQKTWNSSMITTNNLVPLIHEPLDKMRIYVLGLHFYMPVRFSEQPADVSNTSVFVVTLDQVSTHLTFFFLTDNCTDTGGEVRVLEKSIANVPDFVDGWQRFLGNSTSVGTFQCWHEDHYPVRKVQAKVNAFFVRIALNLKDFSVTLETCDRKPPPAGCKREYWQHASFDFDYSDLVVLIYGLWIGQQELVKQFVVADYVNMSSKCLVFA